jgi:hypothetical protein
LFGQTAGDIWAGLEPLNRVGRGDPRVPDTEPT